MLIAPGERPRWERIFVIFWIDSIVSSLDCRWGSIDYDASKRDKSVENKMDVATIALDSLGRRIETMAALDHLETPITARESVHYRGPAVTMRSTVGRVLMGLVTHSIHHLAIIALIVKSYGYEMDSDFGKAASTILYEST